MVAIDTLLLPDVLFATGKSSLRGTSFRILDEFFIRIKHKKIDSIVIEGHTDNRGVPALNKKLSADRAHAVETALRQLMGSLKWPVIARGRADARPMADNRTAAGRQQNRRVELFVYARE
jgi:outer membrane protein OmpA-like peptidoglycan-associated protein